MQIILKLKYNFKKQTYENTTVIAQSFFYSNKNNEFSL